MSGYNPYQPPADDPVGHPMQRPTVDGEALPWEVGQVLSASWRAVKAHWPVLVFAPFLVQLVNQALSYGITMAGETFGPIVVVLNPLLGMAVGAFFAVGLTRIYLTALRGESPDFGALFGGGDRFVSLFITQFLMFVVIMLGFVLLIVPGIIAALGLSMSPYLCIDQGLGPVESLQKSWEITKGHKGDLVVYGLAGGLVILGGLLALIVGVLVAFPVVSAGYVLIYMRLTGQHSIYDET